MRDKKTILLTALLIALLLTGCGADKNMTQFKSDIDNFCDTLSELDTSINSIDAESENAAETVLEQLDQLDKAFQFFAQLDFPEEYDYLEPLADEAADYMSTAVESYHEAFSDGGYNEEIAAYAEENSSRAFKRVQTILAILRGEEPNS